MTTNKDALDAVNAIECLKGTSDYTPETFGAFVWPYRETIRNALQTQEDLVADNQKLRKELDFVVRENAKFEKRHKVWERQIYSINKNPMLLSVGASEYNDYCGDIPILKVTDLLDDRAKLVEALKGSVVSLRKIAAPIGPMHAFWDQIIEYEDLIKRAEGKE